MNEDKDHEHKWRKAGIWDGKTRDGKPTGGITYKCDICGVKAISKQEIKKKGGTIVEDTDVFGNPKSEEKSNTNDTS